jgi:hypothetical protein
MHAEPGPRFMHPVEQGPVVFTAQSRHLFYARMLICRYVLEHGAVPLNPFTLWGYFLDDMVERDVVRGANNNLVRRADQLWVFGPVSDGVLYEIKLAMSLDKPMRFFSAGPTVADIVPLDVGDIEFEPDLADRAGIAEAIAGYAGLRHGEPGPSC